ncbi:MAG: DNA polymerase III subunit delta' [Planctomycetaceae bacterium]
MWGVIRGHDRQREQFEQAVRRDRLAHAYLFVGAEGIGKRRFAEFLAQCLLCEQRPGGRLEACGSCPACIQVQAETHPDLIRIALPEGKRELPVELMIGSRDKRGQEGLCHELAMRPMRADRRIAIVDDAQTMNAESANALLKTLEEPPPGSLLILLTPVIDAVLPTIRSRCQPITFAPLSEQDVAELIVTLGWVSDEQTAREAAALAAGSLVTARQLLQPELRDLRSHLFRVLESPQLDPLAASAAILAGIDELGGDAAAQRVHASWAIRFCIESLRSRMRELSAAGDADDREGGGEVEVEVELIDSVAAQLDRCFDAELQLQRSMPIPLCLEGLFDGLTRIRRGFVEV